MSSASSSSSSASSFSSLASHFDLSCVHFQPSVFSSSLSTTLLGRYFHYYPTVGSTQDLAREAAQKGETTGTLFLAEEQTAGRGRGEGRVWTSENQGNLYSTLLLKPNSFKELSKINFAISLAVATAIQSYGVDARVKWPNDVWIGTRKVSGVLVDVDHNGSAISVYAGFGINVNQSLINHSIADLQANAISVRDALQGKVVERELLLARVLNELEKLLVKDLKEILELYKKVDCLVGKEVTVMPKKREHTTSYYTGLATGFTEEGYLKVKKTGTEEEVALLTEEVTIRLK